MKPRSVASSHTGRRGQDVRHASITSLYGRVFGPIHSSRSRISESTVSDIFVYLSTSSSSQHRNNLVSAERRPSGDKSDWLLTKCNCSISLRHQQKDGAWMHGAPTTPERDAM